MKKFCTTLFALLIVALYQPIFAQNESPVSPRMILEKASCEMNIAFLGSLIQNQAQNKFVIVVSHLGAKEKIVFGKRRLNNVDFFFTKGSTDSTYNLSADSFLVTEGKQAKDRGFLDFYIEGILELRIFFNKNQDLLVNPCVFTPEERPCSTDYEKDFYPCKK